MFVSYKSRRINSASSVSPLFKLNRIRYLTSLKDVLGFWKSVYEAQFIDVAVLYLPPPHAFLFSYRKERSRDWELARKRERKLVASEERERGAQWDAFPLLPMIPCAPPP